MKKLIKNVIRCKYCGDVIESTYSRDFKYCKCCAVAVDGGLIYARRMFQSLTNPEYDYKKLSEWKEGLNEIDI